MRNLREIANQVRGTPLNHVAQFLGGTQDKRDKQRWIFSSCSVWLGKDKDCDRFFDHQAGKGGGGAIDLVIYVLNCGFQEAVTTLAASVGSEAKAVKITPMAKVAAVQNFLAPKACPECPALLYEFLTGTRMLPKHVVDLAIADGRIYADTRRNAVFLCHDPRGRVTGAELRGTGPKPFKGMALGSRRGIGFFTLPHPTPEKLVVVESALDALAYHALFESQPATVVSTAGVLSSCPALTELALNLGLTDISIAYDNDSAGNQAADALIEALSQDGHFTIRRLTPWLKDWNDIVMQYSQRLYIPLDCSGWQHDLLAELEEKVA